MKKINKFLVILLSIVLITAAIGILSGCKTSKVPLTGLSYSDGNLSWNLDSIVDSVGDSYKVFANKVKKSVSVSDGRVIVDLSEEEAEEEEFEVTVEAEGKEVEVDETFKFKKISAFSVNVVDGKFDWSESATQYADYGDIVYDVVIDNKHVAPTRDTNYVCESGVLHTITIRPRISDDHEFYYSDWSEEKSALILSTPVVSNYSFEKNDNDKMSAKLNWTAVNFNGEEPLYKVWINDVEFTTNTTSFDTSVSASDLDLTNGMEVRLQAVIDKADCYSSLVSDAKKYIKLDRVNNVTVSNGKVSFDPVNNAKQYSIRIGSEIYTCYNTEYIVNVSSESLYVQVRPEPEEGYIYNDRNWSDAVYFKMLQTPIIRYENGQIIFDNITGDNTDQIEITISKVDDEERASLVKYQSAKSISFGLDATYTDENNDMRSYFDEAGEYEIVARAIPKVDIGYSSSGYSSAFKVFRLGAIPSVELSLVPDTNTTSSYLKLKVNEPVYGKQLELRYVLKLDGVEISSTISNEFIVPNPYTYDERTYTITIEMVSDKAMVSEGLVLDALEKVQFSMVKLGTPRNVAIDENGAITWEMPAPISDKIKGNNNGYSNEAIKRYVAYIAGTTYNEDKCSVTLSDTLDSGEHSISVYAQSELGAMIESNTESNPKFLDFTNGNNENQTIILSSEVSSTLSLLKLDYPKDIRMVDGTVQWTPVEGATGYKVLFSYGDGTVGDDYTVTEPSFGLRDDAPEYYNQINEGGCAITIVALGNKGKDLQPGELYSFDSENSSIVTFRKLAVTSGISVTDDYISWNPVGNAVRYEADINGSTEISLNTSIDISNWANGEYSVKIRAKGDDVALFDGDYSSAFTFIKLDSMEVMVRKVSPDDISSTEAANTELCDVYYWKEIVGATKYNIKIGENEYTVEPKEGKGEVGEREYTFTPRFTVAGKNVVEFWVSGSDGAVNENGDYTVSSNKVRFIQNVKEMDAPEVLDGRAFSISFNKDGNIAIKANVKPNQNGYGYFFRIGGTPLYSIDNILIYEGATRGSSTIEVAYAGNYFDVDKANDDGSYVYAPGTTVYYLSSKYCSSTGTLNFLNNVSEITLAGDGMQKEIQFKGYLAGARYALRYELYKVGEDDAILTNEVFLSGSNNQGVSLDLTDYCERRVEYSIKVYIIAIGDATEKFSDYSVFSDEKTFKIN